MTDLRFTMLAATGAVALSLGSGAAAQTMTTPAAPATTTTVATTAPQAGMTVKDAAGGTVGTVTAVADGFITVKTDKHEVKLPSSAFTPSEGAMLSGQTQAQLNADVDAQIVKGQAMFKVGTKVSGSGGADAGTVTALDADTVTLKLNSGKLVRVPRTGLAASEPGWWSG